MNADNPTYVKLRDTLAQELLSAFGISVQDDQEMIADHMMVELWPVVAPLIKELREHEMIAAIDEAERRDDAARTAGFSTSFEERLIRDLTASRKRSIQTDGEGAWDVSDVMTIVRDAVERESEPRELHYRLTVFNAADKLRTLADDLEAQIL